MATSSKFDLSASSDRPPYPSGPRGLYGGPSLDRSGSFRESMDNPILSSFPSMSRNSFRVTQGDIKNFFECLHFDPESVGSDNKVQVVGEIKRIANVVLGTLQDGSASGSLKGRLLSSLSHEDLKKTKAALQEGSDEARERGRMFGEALSMFKKFFPSIPLRKKSRADTVSSDRVNVLPVNNHSGLGPRIMKMGAPSHSLVNAPGEQKKSEERTKNTKRTRTSMLDARVNSLAKHCTLMDKDRNAGRGANSSIVLNNDLRPPIESWESSKMKKKRSVIKADVSPSKSSAKPVDSHRELKQGMRQRLATDLAFRSGIGSGTGGIGKLETGVQQTDSGVRTPITRVDHENGALFGKERPSDKERVNLRNINKNGRREDYSSPSPNSSAKLVPSPRPPQFNKGILPKMSPSSQQPTFCSDWEVSQCTNKPSAASGPTNKKRTSSVRSSSPPVAHWAGQKPQKILRAAKRTNFLPIVSNNDETTSVDSMSDAGNDNGFIFAKDFPSISAQQGKLKSEQFSESEESGVAETKKETKKVKKIYAKGDGRARHSVKKASIPVLPTHKNKLLGEEHGDGLRRQGRTSRSLASSRSLMPTIVDKRGTIGAAKQPRASRMGLDKAESKAGRPPMRKPSGRTAYTNNRLSAVHAATDFGDDGQQELLAAAKAVVDDPSHLSLFWRHMELMFRLISGTDIGFLQQQAAEVMPVSDSQIIPASVNANSAANCLNDPFVENLGYTDLIHAPEELISEAAAHTTVPICQRLIAALITDEEDKGTASIEEMQLDSYEPRFQVDAALESGATLHETVGNIYSTASRASNGCNATISSLSLHELEELGKAQHQNHMVSIQNFGGISSSGYLFDGLQPVSEMISTESPEFHHKNMSLNERLLLEIQSLGIFPEQPDIREMENEEISQEMSHLRDEYHQKVSKKRCFILNLLKSASQGKELQENNFEQCALEKLVTMAHAKYTASFGVRGANSKIVKQAAIAFVNRALEHCHRYEASGKSRFSDPSFKDIFNAMLNKIAEVQSVDFITENESGKDYPNTPLGSQQIGGDLYSPNVLLQEPSSSEQNTSRQDAWSNKTKKRKLLDAGNGSPGSGGPPISNTKGKRSERDRDGKGRAGNTLSRSGTTKLGRPVVGNTKGDRKSKAKAKQKTQLSTSVNGLLGKAPEQSPHPCENMMNNSSKEKENSGVDDSKDPVVDLSGLEVPEGQDLASWLNIDDDSLQDHDFMGLEIPMDDLFDVNMMV